MFVASSHTSASVDSGGAEGLPDDCLTDVGRNEEGDTWAQTIALLEQLIQQQDNQTCNKQLKKQTRGLYWANLGRQPAIQKNCVQQNIMIATMNQSAFEFSDPCLSHEGRWSQFHTHIMHKS